MKFYRFTSLLFAALLVLLAEKDACAQWKKVAPNLVVSPPYGLTEGGGGAMIYQSGIVWSGFYNLWMSADTGRTWSLRTPFPGPANHPWISDIAFYDDQTGVISVGWQFAHDIYITHDEGLSWKRITAPNFSGRFYGVCFGYSSDNIFASTDAGDIYSTNDGGLNWGITHLGRSVICIRLGKNGVLHALVAKSFLVQASMYTSTDFGSNWSKESGLFDLSSYSFDQDKCDPMTFYLPNDAWTTSQKSDTTSEIWVTTNSGSSWIPNTPHTPPYYCGSISAVPHAVFTQTLFGIERSTNQGKTWQSIGGPSYHNIYSSNYSRFVTAINSNIVLAVDSQGSVWLTTNSGGDSISNAQTIILQTADQKTDTIGGTVAVPIRLKGLNDTEDVDIVIHYNPILNYTGTYSPAGMKMDIPNESWIGRSKIHITAADSSRILAYSYFDVFADSSVFPKVFFDSVTTLKQRIDPCTLALIPTVTIPANATITPSSGCSIQTISRFMHDSTMPQLSIMPNPTSGEISISSTQNLGDCSITVYDMLGIKQSTSSVILQKNNPAKIILPVANGVYNVRVLSAERTYDLRVMVNK